MQIFSHPRWNSTFFNQRSAATGSNRALRIDVMEVSRVVGIPDEPAIE
jgi:hypothetical protein